ncbi:MAG: DUF4886 domain-containing protein [Clostridia bacterium]|nr:DUF4886 domain-containing protein [Clostridia bacterium]
MKSIKFLSILLVMINLFISSSGVLSSAGAEEYVDGYYEWSLDDGMYSDGGKVLLDTTGRNNATLKEGRLVPYFSNGQATLANSSFYLLDKPVTLSQNKNWRVEWKGRMEAGTTSNCHIILGNDGAEQYIMYASNKIFFGNKVKQRAEFACNRDAVAYKETSYILEGDSDRHVRLTYHVADEAEPVVSDWVEYPQAVNDITVSSLFGNYSNILYKGMIDYVRVWEEYPEELINDPGEGISADFKIVDASGTEVRGTKDDFGKDSFYLTGNIKNTSRKSSGKIYCIMSAYNNAGKLQGAAMKQLALPAKGSMDITMEDGICLDNAPVLKGDKIKAFVFDDRLKPACESSRVVFDGRFAGSIKMLSIGNSYSIDASTMVHDIAAADGVDINILNLHIGGCTLETHWANAQSGAAAYASQLNGISAGITSMEAALKKEKWDYVSLQQGSHESNDFSKFWTEEKPYLTNLSEYIRSLAPQATQLIHQTWAYGNQYAISRLGYTGNAPLARNAMFADVKNAYRQAADKLGVNILPCGEAVQYAQNVMGLTEAQMYRDQYSHLTYDKGRYLVAAVWYSTLTGNSVLTNSYHPAGISSSELQKLKSAVDYVVNMSEYKWR